MHRSGVIKTVYQKGIRVEVQNKHGGLIPFHHNTIVNVSPLPFPPTPVFHPYGIPMKRADWTEEHPVCCL